MNKEATASPTAEQVDLLNELSSYYSGLLNMFEVDVLTDTPESELVNALTLQYHEHLLSGTREGITP